MKLSDYIDEKYPPGTQARRDLDAYVERANQKDKRLERTLGWMKRIPIVGYLMYVFWWAAIDEGYGALDMVCFHLLHDAYVPSIEDLRNKKFKMGRGYRKSTIITVVADLMHNSNQDPTPIEEWLKQRFGRWTILQR